MSLVRINDRIPKLAATLLSLDRRSLDAIHLASATRLGTDLGDIETDDERLAPAAQSTGYTASSSH
ncbi:hypothetical protein Acit_06585 [Aciditerrimonas ferrireducens]|nr:hypothetical protein [Aciditerrimonas ferrireducens]MCK4177136.1 hypothetical protein [Aciditerrimonas ferrireducens]